MLLLHSFKNALLTAETVSYVDLAKLAKFLLCQYTLLTQQNVLNVSIKLFSEMLTNNTMGYELYLTTLCC